MDEVRKKNWKKQIEWNQIQKEIIWKLMIEQKNIYDGIKKIQVSKI